MTTRRATVHNSAQDGHVHFAVSWRANYLIHVRLCSLSQCHLTLTTDRLARFLSLCHVSITEKLIYKRWSNVTVKRVRVVPRQLRASRTKTRLLVRYRSVSSGSAGTWHPPQSVVPCPAVPHGDWWGEHCAMVSRGLNSAELSQTAHGYYCYHTSTVHCNQGYGVAVGVWVSVLKNTPTLDPVLSGVV